jgi:hypothetical protein
MTHKNTTPNAQTALPRCMGIRALAAIREVQLTRFNGVKLYRPDGKVLNNKTIGTLRLETLLSGIRLKPIQRGHQKNIKVYAKYAICIPTLAHPSRPRCASFQLPEQARTAVSGESTKLHRLDGIVLSKRLRREENAPAGGGWGVGIFSIARPAQPQFLPSGVYSSRFNLRFGNVSICYTHPAGRDRRRHPVEANFGLWRYACSPRCAQFRGWSATLFLVSVLAEKLYRPDGIVPTQRPGNAGRGEYRPTFLSLSKPRIPLVTLLPLAGVWISRVPATSAPAGSAAAPHAAARPYVQETDHD